MPTAPRRPCSAPRCPGFATYRGRCPDHATPRGKTAARGYGARWRRLAHMILNRDPICMICHDALSTEADHIIPKAQGGTDAMDNLRGTCRRCNRARRP